MLNHFKIQRRVNFPLIFLVSVVLFFGVGFLVLKYSNTEPHVQPKSTFELLVSVVGIAGAFVYFLYSQHHQDMQMFVNLFKEFNERYNRLNEKLNAVVLRSCEEPLTTAEIGTLYDYFNLCAEEYLFYEAGYIDEKVWLSWLCGMKTFLKNEKVRRLWERETKEGSYYGFKLALIDNANCECGSP